MPRQVSLMLVLSAVLLLATKTGAAHNDELSQAINLTANASRGKQLFDQNCSQCHGENARGTTDGRYPQLAGQHKEVIIKQLLDIRNGDRDNPEMLPFVQESILGGLQEIADIAAYLSSLLMEPYPEFGEISEPETAMALYQQQCAGCHGDKGEGNAGKFYPLIRGQHYEYLMRQMRWIREGKRKNAYPEMVKKIRNLDDTQVAILADYISQLLPSANPDY